jgi:hypothetical protein
MKATTVNDLDVRLERMKNNLPGKSGDSLERINNEITDSEKILLCLSGYGKQEFVGLLPPKRVIPIHYILLTDYKISFCTMGVPFVVRWIMLDEIHNIQLESSLVFGYSCKLHTNLPSSMYNTITFGKNEQLAKQIVTEIKKAIAGANIRVRSVGKKL